MLASCFLFDFGFECKKKKMRIQREEVTWDKLENLSTCGCGGLMFKRICGGVVRKKENREI